MTSKTIILLVTLGKVSDAKAELKELLDWMKEQYQIKTPEIDIPRLAEP